MTAGSPLMPQGTNSLLTNGTFMDCSLLVVSCDAYSDLWVPFFTLLRRYWPDCPFPVYLGSGRLPGKLDGVTTLYSEGGRDWSMCMTDHLSQLSSQYVLVMLDDFFLRKAVSTDKVLHCLNFAHAHDATQVRLIPRPGPTSCIHGESLVGECAPSLPYRLSTQTAIWNRKRLIELLSIGETIWEFEHNGNIRAMAYAYGFYAVTHAVVPHQGVFAHHVVEKGKWLPSEKWIFSRKSIGCDFSRRGVMPLHDAALCHAIQLTEYMLGVFPWRTKLRLKQVLKAILRPFMGSHFTRMRGSALPPPKSLEEYDHPK